MLPSLRLLLRLLHQLRRLRLYLLHQLHYLLYQLHRQLAGQLNEAVYARLLAPVSLGPSLARTIRSAVSCQPPVCPTEAHSGLISPVARAAPAGDACRYGGSMQHALPLQHQGAPGAKGMLGRGGPQGKAPQAHDAGLRREEPRS